MANKNQVASAEERVAGLAQIAHKAEAEIARLAVQIAQMTERQEQAEQEQRQIDGRINQQHAHLETLRANVERLRALHQEEQSYASLAAGTIGERNAIIGMKQAEIALNDAIKELAKAEDIAAKEIARESAHHDRLSASIAQWT